MTRIEAVAMMLDGKQWTMQGDKPDTIVMDDGSVPPTTDMVDAFIASQDVIQSTPKAIQDATPVDQRLDTLIQTLKDKGIL